MKLLHDLCMLQIKLILFTGGSGPGGNQMDGWSGAGQRDYHYSLYNKRKFEEVHGINLDNIMLQIIYYSMLSN